MIDMDSVRLVLQGIGTLAALVNLRRKSVGAGAEPSRSQIDRAVKDVPYISTASASLLAARISDTTLEAISEVIKRARKRFEEAIRDPANNKQARDAEEEIARSTICGELRRIRRLNSGSLPPEFESDWAEFQCA